MDAKRVGAVPVNRHHGTALRPDAALHNALGNRWSASQHERSALIAGRFGILSFRNQLLSLGFHFLV
jgi:hypothetical protein